MTKRRLVPCLVVGLLAACKEPTLLSIPGLETAQILALVPVIEDELDVPRSHLHFPASPDGHIDGLVFEEHQPLVLVNLDEAAINRGVIGGLTDDPSRIRLHPSEHLDCGPKGHELQVNDDGTTQIRQVLGRFDPTIQLFDPDANAIVSPAEAMLNLVRELELELPGDAEPCAHNFRIELEPLGLEQMIGGSVIVDGVEVPASHKRAFHAVYLVGGDRLVLASESSAFAVRRGQAFDPTQDDAVWLEALGLPNIAPDSWSLSSSRIEPLGQAGTFRLVLFLMRTTMLQETLGFALLELDFDGAAFGPPSVRSLSSQPGMSQYAGSARTGSLLGGADGQWTLFPPGRGPPEAGTLNRGDIESMVVTDLPVSPHIVAQRGGFISHGDLRDPENMQVVQVRPDSGAQHMRVVEEGNERSVYSAWKDGALLRHRLGSSEDPEVFELDLPLRIANCGTLEIDACGRGHPVKRPTGLEVPPEPAPAGLIVAAYDGCAEMLVHDRNTSCTTSLEFPLLEGERVGTLFLHPHDGTLWLLARAAPREIYQVHILPGSANAP